MTNLARETLVSALINGAISVAFFLAMFGRSGPVPVWGVGNYAFDFLPQSFAVGVMATLVPGLLCRRALMSGGHRSMSAVPPVGSIIARAFLHGAAAAVAGGALCSLALWLTGADTIANAPAFVLKVAYGAALGALVTWVTLKRMLAAS